MRPLQDRTEPDSDVEIDFNHSDSEETSGWDATLDIDRYLKNKDVDGKLRLKLIRKANSLVRLSSIIFKYSIRFERMDTPSGWTHKSSCPFPDHRDSDPSFGYNSKDDRFNCFGCGRGGGAVQFLSGMQKRPQYEIAKQIISSQSSYEDVVTSLEEEDVSKVDKILFDFSDRIYKFITLHNRTELCVEYAEKLSWNLDMYLTQHALSGSIDPEALSVRIEKILSRLESFGK